MHHASLLIGDVTTAETYIESVCGPLVGSPDYFAWKGGTFGIDEARSLSEAAVMKAFTGKKVFFLAPEKITLEAQNALLKTFEEPVSHTLFFLSLPDSGVVIPTLRSRMQVIRLEHRASHGEAEKFLKLGLKERLVWVKKFVDSEKNLPAFLDELLLALRGRDNNFGAVESVYKLRMVSDQRGASARLVLEHLSLML